MTSRNRPRRWRPTPRLDRIGALAAVVALLPCRPRPSCHIRIVTQRRYTVSSLWDAIETYHAQLSDEVAAECQAQLDEQQPQRGLFFGERPLCTVLRPRFIFPGQYQYL